MTKYDIKQLAYIGDALWEVIIRKIVIDKTSVQKKMHNYTTTFVNAAFQAELLLTIMPLCSEKECEIIKQGRNIKLNINKKNNPKLHSHATAFETLIGFLYTENKEKYNLLEKVVTEIIKETI